MPITSCTASTATDIASIDTDGFVTLHGRADGAIIRGGFKILPETVRRVLVSHPGVRDACVVGVDDARLGQVPFAAVEVVPGAQPSEEELKDLVRQKLPVYNVPVAVLAVGELPRTPALKVSLNICFGQRHARRATVNDTTHSWPVTLTKGGHREQSSKAVT